MKFKIRLIIHSGFVSKSMFLYYYCFLYRKYIYSTHSVIISPVLLFEKVDVHGVEFFTVLHV